jgi:uncharacterized Ntn-hydrolase superfamily protein
MTWSILARDAQGNFGVAIASRFFAVGLLCVHTRAGVGAIATQALMNPLYGPAGLDRLADLAPVGHGAGPDDGRGAPGAAVLRDGAAAVVAALTAADTGQANRQVHVLPAQGPGAAHTGAACIDWCGHQVHEGFSVAGNMLAGPQVVEATVKAYREAAGLPLAERLLHAMVAGEAAGGDKRGKQAAALRIQGDEAYPALDLRVDDHIDPLTELQRLYQVSLERYQPFVTCLPGRGQPAGVTDRGEIEARISRFQVAQKNAYSVQK